MPTKKKPAPNTPETSVSAEQTPSGVEQAKTAPDNAELPKPGPYRRSRLADRIGLDSRQGAAFEVSAVPTSTSHASEPSNIDFSKAIKQALATPLSPSSTTPRVLRFRKLPGGVLRAIPIGNTYSKAELLNSYNGLVRIFGDIQTLVRQQRQVSPDRVMKLFEHTKLGDTALSEIFTLNHYKEWVPGFRRKRKAKSPGAIDKDLPLTAKGAAVVFLEGTTGLQRETLEPILSRARRAKRGTQQPRASGSKL